MHDTETVLQSRTSIHVCILCFQMQLCAIDWVLVLTFKILSTKKRRYETFIFLK